MSIFIELSVIIGIATAVSFVMRLFRQPFVVGYILTGILVGPYALNVFRSTEYAELFSKIGIAILLFIVGLSLNPLVIREIGKASLAIGIGQIALTSVIGYLIIRALGFGAAAAVYGAIALTFSSTIIVLKLLSDKGDLNRLYGKISIGILLVQDFAATVVLLVISTAPVSQGGSMAGAITLLFLKGAAAVAVLFIVSRVVLSRLSSFFASSQELLFVFSLAWGLGVSSVFAGLGFSVEIGALIAGVALSISPFAYEIASRMKPLRDFFVMLFFILLGSQMILSDAGSLLYEVAVLSLFVLFGKPLIVLILMNVLGYKRKVGFQSGLTVSQISEFSLILMILALSLGYVDREAVSLVTLVGIITIAGSTYLFAHSDALYSRFGGHIGFLGGKRGGHGGRSGSGESHDVVIFGYDRVGNDFVNVVEKLGKSYLVVDFNPAAVRKLQERNIPFRYGDAEDVEFLEELGLHGTKLVVSTIPEFSANMLLTKAYRRLNASGIIIVLSHDVEHARELYLAGASYVVMPHHLGAHHASLMIARYGLDVAEFERERNIHLAKLAKRE